MARDVLFAVLIGAIAGGILGWLFTTWWYDDRHDCMPHNPDSCRIRTTGDGET